MEPYYLCFYPLIWHKVEHLLIGITLNKESALIMKDQKAMSGKSTKHTFSSGIFTHNYFLESIDVNSPTTM